MRGALHAANCDKCYWYVSGWHAIMTPTNPLTASQRDVGAVYFDGTSPVLFMASQ
jgi:hypothetical protein